MTVDEFPDTSSCRFEPDTGGSIVISHHEAFTAGDAAERSNPGGFRETSYTGDHPALVDSDEITVALGEGPDAPGCVNGTESGFRADTEAEAFQTMATLVTAAVTEPD